MALTPAVSEHMYCISRENGYRAIWTLLHSAVILAVQNTWEWGEVMWHLTTWVEAVKTEGGDSFSDRDMQCFCVCVVLCVCVLGGKILVSFLCPQYVSSDACICECMCAYMCFCVGGRAYYCDSIAQKCIQLLLLLVISVLFFLLDGVV